ncbi:MAG: cytochrome c biogenesis protein CcsA [Acidimicrobiia bacterium]|nr:cytochrome c biogenesis protein CcsA [Actinomycetota bacterium]MBL6924339.1 cytochrome c biogenesis protein CcsA [Acidimicrobiia bacterium]MBL6926762.1 cytochrome c biogenesis protein CcsA [Acidimicrobiia bacterium]
MADRNTSTSSSGSRLLGVTTLVGLVGLLLFAFVLTEPDVRLHPTTGEEFGQFDAVRLLYLHVPMAVLTYVAFLTCAVASATYLVKRGPWWDVTAHASAEVGTVFCGLVLVTGSIWGRPVWNTWWEWGDVRLMTTLVLFLLFTGYLALRRTAADPQRQARRAAIVALVAVLDIPLINRSVEWWENRTLHQQSTLAELKIEDLTLFTLMLGFVVFGMVFAWLMLHRFRVGWLEQALARYEVETAIAERHAEIETLDLDAAVGETGGGT